MGVGFSVLQCVMSTIALIPSGTLVALKMSVW